MSWKPLCQLSEIPPNAGVAALVNGKQIALFHVSENVYAIDNFDPISKTNILSRGIVGSINNELCVASPLYKQHFALNSGQCIEESDIAVNTYPLRCNNGMVEIKASAVA